MDQQEYERLMLVMIAAGIILSAAEFLVISLLIGKGTIGGYQNGLLAGGGVVVVVVILVWMATFVLKPSSPPSESIPKEPTPETTQ